MATTSPYPHTMKYAITRTDYEALRSRLSTAADRAGGPSESWISTLFFTSYRSRVLPARCQSAEDTPAFALHYYDNDPTYLLLERYREEEQESAMVTEAECRALLAGETGWLLDRRNPVLRDFHAALTQQMLLPQVLLTYHREAYALDGMDLWVALDSDIRATLQHMDFLDPDLLARDTADQTGRMLLSISYSRAIPDELLCLLEETAPRRRLLPGERGPV